jgi:hypothetical protein
VGRPRDRVLRDEGADAGAGRGEADADQYRVRDAPGALADARSNIPTGGS